MIAEAPTPKPVETPTERRSRQINHLLDTSRDITGLIAIEARYNVIKPLGQKARAQLKKNVETKLRTLNSLLEGIMS